jgi:hypothetical protein
VLDKTVEDAVAHYLQIDAGPSSGISGSIKLGDTVFLTDLKAKPSAFCRDQEAMFTIEIAAQADEIISDLALIIYAITGERVSVIDFRSPTGVYKVKRRSKIRLNAKIANLPLVEADYNVGLWLNSTTVSKIFTNLMTFQILPSERNDGLVSREPQYRGFVELIGKVEVV